MGKIDRVGERHKHPKFGWFEIIEYNVLRGEFTELTFDSVWKNK